MEMEKVLKNVLESRIIRFVLIVFIHVVWYLAWIYMLPKMGELDAYIFLALPLLADVIYYYWEKNIQECQAQEMAEYEAFLKEHQEKINNK